MKVWCANIRIIISLYPDFCGLEVHITKNIFKKAMHICCYCCDRKSRAACAQSFAPWQKATIEIMRRNLSYRCLLAPRIYIFVIRARPVRGVSHNQRKATGEVATTSPPFYYEPHRSHVLCVKAELGTTSTSWSQHHFVDVSLSENM